MKDSTNTLGKKKLGGCDIGRYLVCERRVGALVDVAC